MKNLLILIALCLVIWGVVFEYREHKVDHALSSGDTISPDGSAPASDSSFNRGTASSSTDQPQPVRRVVVPGSAPAQITTNSTNTTQATNSPESEPTTLKVPATDTIPANPPNGTVFSGTGHYQVYRQGNLTWRINTDTGQSCVLFATDAEWRKPRVYQRGCAQS